MVRWENTQDFLKLQWQKVIEPWKNVLSPLRPYKQNVLHIVIIFLVFVLLPVVIISIGYPHSYSKALQNFSYWAVWFSAVIALFAFVAVLIAAYATFGQLRLFVRQVDLVRDQLDLVRADIKASSYSQLYSRLDTINILLVENIRDLKLEKDTFTHEDFAFSTPERHFANMILTLYENVYYQKENSHVLDDSDWVAWQLGIKDTFKIKYITEYWWNQGGRNFYTREFQEEVDRIFGRDLTH